MAVEPYADPPRGGAANSRPRGRIGAAALRVDRRIGLEPDPPLVSDAACRAHGWSERPGTARQARQVHVAPRASALSRPLRAAMWRIAELFNSAILA